MATPGPAPDAQARGFHASYPTRVVAGSGVADGIGGWCASYGTRVLLVAGSSHARASGLLGRIEASLRTEGMELELLEGIPANPTSSIVDAGALLARAWRADVVVAVGGGSVIDAAKAIATAAAMEPSRPFRDHLSGLRPPTLIVDAALPVVALPTLPGSASETNGTSVITDDVTGRKLSASSELASPRIALLDPLVALDAPAQLLGAGLADAGCHALEAALSTGASAASDAAAEQALRMLVRLGAAPLDRDPAALLEAWWASNLAGQALTLAGSIATHPLAHAISARLDAHHGAAVAALEPAILATFRERFAESGGLTKVAGWLEVRGAEDADTALRGVLNRLARWFASLGVRSSLAELGVLERHAATLVRDARESGSRGLRNLPGGEPSAEELFTVLDLALALGPTTPAKRVLARLAD